MAKGKKFVDLALSGVKTPAQMKAEMAVDRAKGVLPKAERDANLEKMLDESAVKERLYHSTYSDFPEFKTNFGEDEYFQFGSHVGSVDAASNRLSLKQAEDAARGTKGSESGANIMPVYAKITNPLRLDENRTGRWGVDDIMSTIMEKADAGDIEGIPPDIVDDFFNDNLQIEKFLGKKVKGEPRVWQNTMDWNPEERSELLTEFIEKLGHDGIVYNNLFEGGGDSYLVLRPTQLKSAIGNQGTYDTTNPDITKARGGIIKMGKGGVGRKLGDKILPKVEAPSVMTRSEISDLADYIKNREGGYGLRRVERAADEIPRLGDLYTQDALRGVFSGDNARALMTMNPADFERYSAPLLTDLSQKSKDNIANLKAIQKVGGFSDVPFFLVNKELAGSTGLPWITGHEGRHRSRAIDEAGIQAGLVQFLPRAELREPFPRRSQEQYIEAIRKEMELSGNKVKPEKYYLDEKDEKSFQRPTIDLPDLYANGGIVKMAEGGEPSQEELDRMRLELNNSPVIQATPQTPLQRGIGTLGGYMDRAGQFVSKSIEPLAETHPVKHFLADMFLADTLKSAGTALQDYTKTSRDITEDQPYRRAPITGSGQTMSLDPRMLDVIGFAQPAASLGIKAGKAGVKAATPFAKDVGEMASEMYMSGRMPGMVSPNAYVVKPKGGNWLGEGVDKTIEPLKVRLNDQFISGEMINEMAGEDLWSKIISDGKQGSARNWLYSNRPDVFDKIYGRESIPINNWLETKLKKYIKNEMGTPEDPVRKLADQGKLHTSTDEFPNIMDDEFTDVFSQGYIGERRKAAGFPTESYADTFEGRNWEASTDMAINRKKAKTLLKQADSPAPADSIKDLVDQNPWLRQTDPDTPIYDLDRSRASDLGFDHIVDELKNAMRVDSDLPEKLRIEPTKLEKMTVPQVIERVSEINKWRAENQAAANQKLAMNPATQVFKEYPDQGYKWVELAMPKITVDTPLPEGFRWLEPKDGLERLEGPSILDPERTRRYLGNTKEEALVAAQERSMLGAEQQKMLEDALKYEGDTMGHCVGGYCPDLLEGRSRIYSLRDSKGQPHVTIEVSPNEIKSWYDVDKAVGSLEGAKLRREFEEIIGNKMYKEADFKMFMENKGIKMPPSIEQIKGKGNAKPKDTYLPFVQDFVQTGEWSKVEDLKNTGLIRAGIGGKLMTPAEHAKWLARGEDGMKSGGKVQFAKSLDAMRHELTKAK
jgi:hypothetical protein